MWTVGVAVVCGRELGFVVVTKGGNVMIRVFNVFVFVVMTGNAGGWAEGRVPRAEEFALSPLDDEECERN